MKILLLIPTFNCQEQIERLLTKSSKTVNRHFDELLIIDNGSQDNTVAVAIRNLRAIAIKSKVVQNNENISLGGSLKTGFSYAKNNNFDFVAVLHGDDQAKIEDVLPTLEIMDLKDIDVAIGARFHKHSLLIGYSLFRKFGNKLLNLYCNLITGAKVYDLIAGLNVFRLSKLNLREVLNYPNNLTFDAHLLLRAIHLNQKIHFFPITWTEVDQVSNAKVIRQGINILALFTKYLFLRDKAIISSRTPGSFQNFTVMFEKGASFD
jgi:glycosyltransferase involved in cell wall biosynthesis